MTGSCVAASPIEHHRYSSAGRAVKCGEFSRQACFGSPSRLEAGQRLALVAVDVEDLLEFGQDQQVLHLAVGIQQFEGGALLPGTLVAGHQLADAGAVHVGHSAEVQDDVLPPLVQERVDRLSQLDVPLPDGDLAGEVDDGDFSVVPGVGLHPFLRLIASPPRPARPACSILFSRTTSVPFPRRRWNSTRSTKCFMKKMPLPLVRKMFSRSRGLEVCVQSKPGPWSRTRTRNSPSSCSKLTSIRLLASIAFPCLMALMTASRTASPMLSAIGLANPILRASPSVISWTRST